MPNLLTFTEAFDNSAWTKNDATITADQNAAPEFAGESAQLADLAADNSSTTQGFFRQDQVKGSNDSSAWIASLFVRKDSTTNRFPRLELQFRNGGTAKIGQIRLNTSTGAVATEPGNANVADSGVVDVDSLWWRMWLKVLDNATGNLDVRVAISPACASSISGGAGGSVVGSIVVWGANVTKSDTLQEYEPDPFYDFPGTGWETLTTLGSSATSYSDTAVEGAVRYDYRILATNAFGSSPSNIVDATAIPGSPPPLSLRIERRGRRGMFRGMR